MAVPGPRLRVDEFAAAEQFAVETIRPVVACSLFFLLGVGCSLMGILIWETINDEMAQIPHNSSMGICPSSS